MTCNYDGPCDRYGHCDCYGGGYSEGFPPCCHCGAAAPDCIAGLCPVCNECEACRPEVKCPHGPRCEGESCGHHRASHSWNGCAECLAEREHNGERPLCPVFVPEARR